LDAISPERLNRGGGILFLPNHPAEIDPVILMTLLWERFHPRPLVVEHFYYQQGLRFFMKLVSALPLPSVVASNNKWKLRQIEKLFNNIAQELKKGEHFLIYPSGRLRSFTHTFPDPSMP
jgi:long-chain-fatty-acid--[acyl-carrier-protein] ligase